MSTQRGHGVIVTARRLGGALRIISVALLLRQNNFCNAQTQNKKIFFLFGFDAVLLLTQLTDARCTVCPDRPMPVRTAWYTPYMEGITGPPPAIAFHTVTARTELLLILHSILQVLGWSTPTSVFARIVSGMDVVSVAVCLEPMALHIHRAAHRSPRCAMVPVRTARD